MTLFSRRVRAAFVSTAAAITLTSGLAMATAPLSHAANYAVDPGHSFVQFRIKHLGYSWLIGRFNEMDGTFSYDAESPGDSTINVTVATASVDSNHAKRDEHLRSEDFLDVDKFPQATFVSNGFTPNGEGGVVSGELTLHGVTKSVEIEVTKLGEGKDPWGGYRAGFEGELEIVRADYDMGYNLGPASESMTLELFVEGIRQ